MSENFSPHYNDPRSPIEVKIVLEGMRYTVTHAIYDHQKEISKIVEQEIDNALKEFDFVGQIKSNINQVLSDIIKKSIENTIKDVFMYDDQVQEMIKSYVVENINLILKGER